MPGHVDSHHHVWTLARGDYGWLTPALAPIYRDYTLDDLAPLSAAAQIATTVLVQAAPTVAETRFLLDVARGSGGMVQGVVGWVDLAAANAVDALRDLARDPLLKSVRPMLQDIADPAWILRADVQPALAALPLLGLRFDALVKPPQLPALLTMLERHPDLPVVVDHGAKPDIAAGKVEPWRALMREVAAHPRAHCKLSGLATEAAASWTPDDLRPCVDHLLDCFGPKRLMWGSDWPVVELRGGYARWRAATHALFATLDAEARGAVLGDTARRFYGLAP
ncbi:MAG: amidohydrolase family protein [Betaproteobacteria bacterium]